MKTKVTLSGGFHNSSEIKLRIDFPHNALLDYADKKVYAKDLIEEYATPYQRKRLENHFCGINGCTCRSWQRADVDTTDIDKNAEQAKFIQRIKERPRSKFFEKRDGACGMRIDTYTYHIENEEEFAKKYAAENGYDRYEIVTTGYRFSTSPDVYFSGDGRAIGFFKSK